MSKLVRKTAIAIKSETTQGTPVSPAATDFLLAENVVIEPDFEQIPRNYYRANLDLVKGAVGKRSFHVTFRTELKGSGGTGAYTPLGAAIKACGFSETVNVGTSAIYAPISAAPSSNFYGPATSCTIEVYKDGIKHIAAGCVGTFKGVLQAGQLAYLDFEFRGVYAEPTDASPGTETYNTTDPPIVKSASFTVHSTALVIEKLEFDVGNEIVERPSVNAATSLLGFMIAGRNPSGTIDPEMETLATHNFFSKVTSLTDGTLAFTLGSVAGNIVGLAFANAQYFGVKYAERNGILTMEPNLRFTGTGNDWLTITVTLAAP